MNPTSAMAAKSPLREMTQSTPTRLWNDSAAIQELTYFHRARGSGSDLQSRHRIRSAEEGPKVERKNSGGDAGTTGGDGGEIGWQLVQDIWVQGAALLKPIFDREGGKNGRLSIQTDPRFFRDPKAIVEQAVRFSELAPNMIVKIPATRAGFRRWRKRRIGESASMQPCASLYRSALPLRRPWNADSRGANERARMSPASAPFVRLW